MTSERGVAWRPTREDTAERIIEMGAAPVACRGEELHPVWWRGRQWAVTTFGVECLDGTYAFEASRLPEGMKGSEPIGTCWLLHMAEKEWVDQDDFATAWMVALALHGIRGIDPARIRQAIDSMSADGD